MPLSDLIIRTANHVQAVLSGDGTGHDWWHVYRDWKMARRIGHAEQADPLIVELAALLHDIVDWKLHEGDSSVGPARAREWLDTLDLEPGMVDHICRIIANISFKGAGVEQPVLSLEGKGPGCRPIECARAIGIARAFAYDGVKGRAIYDPALKPTEHNSPEAYMKGGTSVNHFYEKLLLLKDRMSTDRQGDGRRAAPVHGRVPAAVPRGVGGRHVSSRPDLIGSRTGCVNPRML